jgi:cytochrome c
MGPRAPPRDTVDAVAYEGWKQFSLNCARCHGDDALGTSFGPNLVLSLQAEGPIPTRGAFIALLSAGRPDRGLPSASTLGLSPDLFEGLYTYLSGRSAGRLHGGRPARRTP